MITPGEDGSAGLVFQTLKGAEIKFTLDSNLLHALGKPLTETTAQAGRDLERDRFKFLQFET